MDGGPPPSIDPTEGPTIDAIELISEAPPAAPVAEQRPSRPRGHVKEFGAGRVCGSPGCSTLLSRYNGEQLCWAHEQSTRAAREAPTP